MKPREIHDALLSLLCRGLGFWLLYSYIPFLMGFIDLVMDEFSSTPTDHRDAFTLFYRTIELLFELGISAYFILGAPPFLKWAARERP